MRPRYKAWPILERPKNGCPSTGKTEEHRLYRVSRSGVLTVPVLGRLSRKPPELRARVRHLKRGRRIQPNLLELHEMEADGGQRRVAL